MPNSKYRKGADFERKLVNEARAKGMIAARTAGSKSPIDVFIIDKKNHHIQFIQAKIGNTHGLTKQEMIDFEEMTYMYKVRFKVVFHEN